MSKRFLLILCFVVECEESYWTVTGKVWVSNLSVPAQPNISKTTRTDEGKSKFGVSFHSIPTWVWGVDHLDQRANLLVPSCDRSHTLLNKGIKKARVFFGQLKNSSKRLHIQRNDNDMGRRRKGEMRVQSVNWKCMRCWIGTCTKKSSHHLPNKKQSYKLSACFFVFQHFQHRQQHFFQKGENSFILLKEWVERGKNIIK